MIRLIWNASDWQLAAIPACVVVTSLSLILYSIGASDVNVSPAPRLSPEIVSLGAAAPAQQVACSFTLTNPFSLRATGITLRPSCQCTQATVQSSTLDSGASTDVDVTVAPGRQPGKHSIGIVIEYELNDEVRRELVALEVVVGSAS